MLNLFRDFRDRLINEVEAEGRERLRATLQTALKLGACPDLYDVLRENMLEIYRNHQEPAYFTNIPSDHGRFEQKRDHLIGTFFRRLYPDNWKAALANEIFVRPETLRDAFLPQEQPLVLSDLGNRARTSIIDFGQISLIRTHPDQESVIQALCSNRDSVNVRLANRDQLQRLFLGECSPPYGDRPLRATAFTDNRIETIFRMWAAFRVAEVGLQDLAHRWQGHSLDYQNCNANEWINTILTEESNEEKVNKIYSLADDVGLAVTLVQGAQAAFGIDSNRYSDGPSNNPHKIVNNLVTDFESLKGKLLKRFKELKRIDDSMSLILSDYAESRLNGVLVRPLDSEANLFNLVVPITEIDSKRRSGGPSESRKKIGDNLGSDSLFTEKLWRSFKAFNILPTEKRKSSCLPLHSESHLNGGVGTPLSSEAGLVSLVMPIPGTDLSALEGTEIQAENTQNSPETVEAALEILRVAVRGDSVGTFLLDSLENLFNQAPSSK